MEHKRRQIRTRQANQPRPNIVVYHREPRITARAQKSAVSCHLIACADRCDRQNRDKLLGQLRRSRRKGIINMQNRELRQKQDDTGQNPIPTNRICKVCSSG